MNLYEYCPDKIKSAEEAVSKISRGSRVFIGTGCGEPQQLIRAMVKDPALQEDFSSALQTALPVAQADLAEVISMLTFCQRGERFSDGHWGNMLERGYIRAILNRLEGLRQKMEY